MTTGRDRLEKGYVQIYTGNSKGKTTAALGLAFRAMGRGMRTYIGQFMKGQLYGELEAAKTVGEFITIEQYGENTFVHVTDPPDPKHVKMAREGFAKLEKAMISCDYDIVVADEINTAIFFKLILVQDVLGLMDQKPDRVELVLTGRYAPQELIDRADLATEMKQIKHYFDKGVQARDGIER